MQPTGTGQRINQYLARAGCGSRRSVEALVRAGRVSVNGRTETRLDRRIAPGDEVRVDGRLVAPPREYSYYAFNKPKGYVVSRAPQGGDQSIYALLPRELQGLQYAGRLDRESRGLLLLSDDGDFLQRVAHPSRGWTKRYRLLVRPDTPAAEARYERALGASGARSGANGLEGLVDELRAAFCTRGVRRDGPELLRAERLALREASMRPDRPELLLDIDLKAGRKRQLRRMFAAVEYAVLDLYRYAVGPVDLERDGPPEGEVRPVDPAAKGA